MKLFRFLFCSLALTASVLCQSLGDYPMSHAATNWNWQATTNAALRSLGAPQLAVSTASLPLLNPTIGPETVIVLDKFMGGEFVALSSSDFTINQGTVFASADASKVWVRRAWLADTNRAQIAWFGAVPNDGLNDYTAIQNTRAVASTLIFPPGTTTVTNHYIPFLQQNPTGTLQVGHRDETWIGSEKNGSFIDFTKTAGLSGDLNHVGLLHVAGGHFEMQDISLLNYQFGIYSYPTNRHVTNNTSIRVSGGNHMGGTFYASGYEYNPGTTTTGQWRSNVIANGTFVNTNDWDFGTGWALSGGTAVHTPGSTNALKAQVSNCILRAGDPIRVAMTVTASAGSFLVHVNGNISQRINATLNGATELTISAERTGNADIQILPDTTFDGSVDNVQFYVANWGDYFFEDMTVDCAPEFDTTGNFVRIQGPVRKLVVDGVRLTGGSQQLYVGVNGGVVKTNAVYLVRETIINNSVFEQPNKQNTTTDKRGLYYWGEGLRVRDTRFSDFVENDVMTSEAVYTQGGSATFDNCLFDNTVGSTHKGQTYGSVNVVGNVQGGSYVYNNCTWDTRNLQTNNSNTQHGARAVYLDDSSAIVRIRGGTVLGPGHASNGYFLDETDTTSTMTGFDIDGVHFYSNVAPQILKVSGSSDQTGIAWVRNCTIENRSWTVSAGVPIIRAASQGVVSMRVENNVMMGNALSLGTVVSLGSAKTYGDVIVARNKLQNGTSFSYLITGPSSGTATVTNMIVGENDIPVATSIYQNRNNISVVRYEGPSVASTIPTYTAPVGTQVQVSGGSLYYMAPDSVWRTVDFDGRTTGTTQRTSLDDSTDIMAQIGSAAPTIGSMDTELDWAEVTDVNWAYNSGSWEIGAGPGMIETAANITGMQVGMPRRYTITVTLTGAPTLYDGTSVTVLMGDYVVGPLADAPSTTLTGYRALPADGKVGFSAVSDTGRVLAIDSVSITVWADGDLMHERLYTASTLTPSSSAGPSLTIYAAGTTAATGYNKTIQLAWSGLTGLPAVFEELTTAANAKPWTVEAVVSALTSTKANWSGVFTVDGTPQAFSRYNLTTTNFNWTTGGYIYVGGNADAADGDLVLNQSRVVCEP